MADVEAQENAQSEVLVPFERTRELGAGSPIQKKRASAASSCRAPAVSFNQADRVAYVTGFAKRKRERREKALKAYDEKDRQAKLRKHKERRGARKAQLENMIASDVEQNPASSAGGGSDEHRHRSDSGEHNDLANGVTVYMESLELPTPAQSAQQQRAQRCQSQNSNPANAADADDDDEDGSKKGMDRYSKQRQWNQTGNANKAAGTPSTGRPSGSKQKERLEKAKKRMHSRQGVSKKQKSTNSSKAGKKKTRIKKKQKS